MVFLPERTPEETRGRKLRPPLDIEEKKKHRFWLFWKNGNGRVAQESSLRMLSSARIGQTESLEQKIAHAQQILQELKSNDIFNDLALKAERYLKAVYQARDLSFHDHVLDNLREIETLHEQMEIVLYTEELKKVGVLLEEGKFTSDDRKYPDILLNALLSKEDPCLYQRLLMLAICRDAAKKFPRLSVWGTITKVKELDSHVGALLYVRGGVRLIKRMDGRFSVRLQKNSEKKFLAMTAPSGEQYVFSKDALRPFSLAQEKSQERFVMPSIIEGLPSRSTAYRAALLASGLGMRDVVFEIARISIQQEIKRALERQEIWGKFLSKSEQKKWKEGHPLVLDIKKRHAPLTVEVLNWLHRIRSISLASAAPDIVVETQLDGMVRYRAEFRSVSCYQDGSLAKRLFTKTKYDISCFMVVGPWVYKLSLPHMEKTDKKALVGALSHTESFGGIEMPRRKAEELRKSRIAEEEEWEYEWKI